MRIVFLFLCLSISLYGEDWTVAGKDYHNVKVSQVEADCVHITYDGGIGSVPLADLGADLQKRFGYDPVKAAIATKAEQERQVLANKQLSQELTQRPNAAPQAIPQDDWGTIRKTAVRLYGVVLQKVPGGYLIGTRASNPGYDNAEHFGYYMSQDGNPTPASSFVYPFGTMDTMREDLRIFLASNRDMVDDERVDLLIYPTGEGSYETVLGAQSTVRKYSELPNVQKNQDGKWVMR